MFTSPAPATAPRRQRGLDPVSRDPFPCAYLPADGVGRGGEWFCPSVLGDEYHRAMTGLQGERHELDVVSTEQHAVARGCLPDSGEVGHGVDLEQLRGAVLVDVDHHDVEETDRRALGDPFELRTDGGQRVRARNVHDEVLDEIGRDVVATGRF